MYYISANYDASSERESFLENLADTFVKKLLQENKMLEIGTFNGLRINPETGKHERILKLEEGLVAQLRQKIATKYRATKPAIPAPALN